MADLVYKDLSYKINGALFEVHNALGFGHRESVYQESLVEEFSKQYIPFQKQPVLTVFYKGKKVGTYIPDFVIAEKVIVELKSMEFLPPRLTSQLINYLKGINFHLGLLVNFGEPKVKIVRRVYGLISEDSSPISVNPTS